MTIEDVFKKLKEEFGNDSSYKFELSQKFFKLEEDNEYSSDAVDLIVEKDNHIIMAIKFAKDKDELNKVFNFYQSYCPDPYWYVVLMEEEFTIKERPYINLNKSEQGKFSFDHIIPFDFTATRIVDFSEIIHIIRDFDFEKQYCMHKNTIVESLTDYATKYGIKHCLISDIEEKNIEFNNKEYWFDSKTEIRFMAELLNGEGEMPSTLYRYTSARTLKRIFNNEKESENLRHSMSSLVTMNDTTEMDYANKYLKEKGVETITKDLEKERKESIHAYITSLSDKEDDLTLWRLYGDSAKGISIEYEVPQNIDSSYFMLARVSYANKEDKNDNKLNFIAELMNYPIHNRKFRLKHWNIWQHFFKPHDYDVENEIRLLAFANELEVDIFHYDRKWITTTDGIFAPLLNFPLKSKDSEIVEFPLTIKSIILGCKFEEKEANQITWEHKIIDECAESVHRDFKVKISTVNNYR